MKVIIKNSDLVFQRKHIPQVVYKDYWVRGSDQYIKLTDLPASVLSLGFNNYKGRLDIFFDTDTPSTSIKIIAGRSSYLACIAPSGAKLSFKNNGVGMEKDGLTGASDHYIEFDNSVASATIDGTTETFTAPSASSLDYMWIFASGTNDTNATPSAYISGRIKFKRLKLYNATSNTLLCDIRPALVDNVPCLYDSVSETRLFSADETALVLEDAQSNA